MTVDGNVITGEGASQYFGPPNELKWPLRYLPKSLNILVYPGRNDYAPGVFTRVSTDKKILDKVMDYFLRWDGKNTNFDPTHVLITTWKNFRVQKWSASVRTYHSILSYSIVSHGRYWSIMCLFGFLKQ